MVVAEIASGGDTIPPNKNPRANVKPGIKAYDANATTQDVRITIWKRKAHDHPPPFPKLLP
jgi:hypothetical protein